jgi:succinylglutamate desuccinylase
MKFAIIGGTHGNEPVGIKSIENLTIKSQHHSYQTFVGNPKAYNIQKRYVDSDLNRSFGDSGKAKGYELERSKELTDQIQGQFDFILDLHTTTSNMGLTVILTKIDETSLRAACYLQELIPDLKIIVSMRAGADCPYTSALAQSALTVEFGPVSNNVVATSLVKSMHDLINKVLSFDFKQNYNYEKIECYQVFGIQSYPEQGGWMIHQDVDGHDFNALKSGDPIFTNINDEEITYKGENTIYPLFVNEAAYQENNTAMEVALKTTLHRAISKIHTP